MPIAGMLPQCLTGDFNLFREARVQIGNHNCR